MRDHKHIQIPTPFPETLEDCLVILTKIKYKSFGFPHVFLSFDSDLRMEWSVCFRNPVNFSNDWKGDIDPTEACHKCFEALNKLEIL